MVLVCPPGTIRKKSYTTKRGVHVRATCVPDKGKPGKTAAAAKVLPKPLPGALGKYGYGAVKTTLARERRAALAKAVQREGYATVIRRLNLIANYNKLSDPRAHTIMRTDLKWIQEHLSEYSLKAQRKASKKASRKVSRKASTKASRKVSRKASKKASRKGSKKAVRARK